MRQKTAVLLSTVVALGLMSGVAGSQSPTQPPRVVSTSGCVSCHAHTGKGGVVFPEYIRWAASVHAARNVGCEDCHGGDANTNDQEKAHAGMLPPSAPDSPVSPKKVPQTCARCHDSEYQHYVQSKHFQRLSKDEQGANCVTCHGSTATTVPTAATVRHTCEICHTAEKGIDPAVPERAFHALISLTEARGQVALAEAAVLVAKEQKKDTTTLDRGLARSRESVSRAVAEWHAFSLPVVEKAATDAYDFASQTRIQAEQGAIAPVLIQGMNNFWPVILFVLLAASVMLNLLILLRLSRRPPH